MMPALFEKMVKNLATGSHTEEVECVDRPSLLQGMAEAPTECEVCVVGAGPAGLMLATNLARFGVKVEIIDDRSSQTPVGR